MSEADARVDPAATDQDLAVPIALSALSLGSAAIHFAVLGEHFAEYAVFGIFFATVAWLQAIWAVAVVARPSGRLLAAGALGNLVVAALWLLSRTAGLPIGPEPGEPEVTSFLDLTSTIFEVLIVVGTLILWRKPLTGRGAAGKAASAMALVLALATIPVTSAALVSSAQEEGEMAGMGGHEGMGTGSQDEDSEVTEIDLGGGRSFQGYVASGESPISQVHLTFEDEGAPLPIESVSVSGISPSGATDDYEVTLLAEGHYVVNAELETGSWAFEVMATTMDGEKLRAEFSDEVEQG